jgi:predicted ferric reductase
LVAGLVGLGAGLVIFLWWHDTPAGVARDAGDRLVAAGRVSGLVGAYLILVVVLLLGRIPWLDWLVGMDRLASWHRRLARWALSLLVAHALCILCGYALVDHSGLGMESRNLVMSYPDVLIATVGLLILIVVAVLSAGAIKRRVKYQTWYFIHLYTYLAIALSFAHQLATGADFATHPVNRAVWVGMYVLVGALLVWYRLVLPVRDALRHRLHVAGVVAEGPGIASVYVTGRRLELLAAEAGQFFMWRFMTREGWWQAHPFSLSAAPDGRRLRLTVKAAGDFTADITRLRPGVRVMAEGPYGAFTWHRRYRRRVLLIGGGIGVAPLRALLEALPARPGEIAMVYRASGPSDVVFRAELDGLAARRGATVYYVVGPRSPDPLGPEQLVELIPDVIQRDVYVCGPPGMMAAMVATLRAVGVPGRHIHREDFGY